MARRKQMTALVTSRQFSLDGQTVAVGTVLDLAVLSADKINKAIQTGAVLAVPVEDVDEKKEEKKDEE